MKKISIATLTLLSLACPRIWAQSPEPSGIYQYLTVAVDPRDGTVTGYYENVRENPNEIYLSCRFYLAGKKAGNQYSIQTWSPKDRTPVVLRGTLAFEENKNGKAAVRLKLDELRQDCWNLDPSLGKDEGSKMGIQKSADWIEIRVVSASKAPYHEAADLSSEKKSYGLRGEVLKVLEKIPGWRRISADGRKEAWVQESDLSPTVPVDAMPEPAKIKAPKSPAKAPSTSAKPVETITPAISTPAMTTDRLPSTKELVDQLKVKDAQAFEMALTVLQNPDKRPDLAPKAQAVEADLNRIVAQLNAADPGAYQKESHRISETFLDLQYVKQAQPVVSLRLNQEIRRRPPN
ncbi:MAG: hypothetical protein K8R69_00835 [Deltaproteobacteria bacterium]|nr:hypothetical protein [Deltaproteobacteria bacterium]